MNAAIIVAAGTGQRFDSDVPKQFIEINGKQIVMYSIERFAMCEAVDSIVVVVPGTEVEAFEKRDDVRKISKVKAIVSGSSSRAGSVLNGLRFLDENIEIVAVHDGARPLVTSNEISLTIERAREVGAACLTAPVVDTIKKVQDGWITGTIERRSLRRAMTPQAFRYEILMKAFEGIEPTDEITDECSLVERLGQQIASVPGGTRNIKITHREDIELAASYISEGY